MKMAEFVEGCNGEEVETCGGVSEIKKKFVGVSKTGNRWKARVRDLKLKVDVHLGCYATPEEAAIAVRKKRLEFEEMYKGLNMNIGKGYFNGVKLPVGVRRDNGRWRVQLRHPKLKRTVQLGSYKTCEEAAIVAEMKRAEFRDLQEPNCKGSKTAETSVTFERELEYDSSTSSSGVDYLNNIALDYELKTGVPVYSSPTSVENSSSESVAVSDVTCGLDFDRVVCMDVVNEYGQLADEFVVLDEQMWLNSD